jgi:sterol desaturase/sphingolipid hydroxylase (fatty acid hydroxylase superfamily)
VSKGPRSIPSWLSSVAVFGVLGTLLAFSRKFPLRKQTQNDLRRGVRNLTIAAIAGASVAMAQKPVVEPLSQLVERRRWGLLKMIPLPWPLETLMAVVLMDYTLYVWHWLTHKNAFLWRFHEAHHIDLDLDATTAVRFHFGEMLLSVPWRAAQVLFIGVSPRPLSIWQTLTLVQILFHHSNLRLPVELERQLARVIVTPRMHGIHHSSVKSETDSNWSTIFSFFDRLHGTLKLNVPQDQITIGVPAYRRDDETTLFRTLALPFRRGLFSWARPEQPGPERGELTGSEHSLAP